MTRYMVTCMTDAGDRVLASRSNVFTSIAEAARYADSVAPIRLASVILVTDAESAAEAVYREFAEHVPDAALDGNKMIKLIRRERSSDQEIEVSFVGSEYAVGYPTTDFGYFVNHLLKQVDGGGA